MTIVAIGNLKGGVGKSTLAVNLACELAAKYSVKLIDADAQGTAIDWLSGGTLPITGQALPLEDGKKAPAWLRAVKGQGADMTIIDLPPATGPATAAAFMISDLILVPIGPSGLDLRAAAKALDLLKEARAARSDGGPKALLIPFKVDRRTGAGREIEAALHEMEQPVGPGIGLRSAFVDSATARSWVGAFAPRSTAHQEIQVLASLVDRLTRRKDHGAA